jgi:hypothetical protein
LDVEPDRELSPEPAPVIVVELAESAESAVAELQRRAALWDAAVKERDEAAAGELLAADFALELVQPVRNVMKRQVWLEVLPDYLVHEWTVEEEIVDLDGEYAAMLRRVRMRATVMGEDRSGIFVVSDLWRRVDGEWRVWRRHSTPLMAGRLADRRPG